MTERWQPPSPPVTAANLAVTLSSNRVVVIHFWAGWNGYDRPYAATLAGIESEFQGQITFQSAVVDDPELWPFYRECEVLNVPALGLFVRGKHVKTIIGTCSDGEL